MEALAFHDNAVRMYTHVKVGETYKFYKWSVRVSNSQWSTLDSMYGLLASPRSVLIRCKKRSSCNDVGNNEPQEVVPLLSEMCLQCIKLA